MKKLIALALISAVAGVSSVTAQSVTINGITYDPGNVSLSTYYIHDFSAEIDAVCDEYYVDPPDITNLKITDFAWGADQKMYFNTQCDIDDYWLWSMGLGFYSKDGSTVTQILDQVESMLYQGSGVVAVGNNIRYNPDGGSTQWIATYDTTTGATPVRGEPIPNYGLASNGSDLFFTNGVSGGTNISYSQGGTGTPQLITDMIPGGSGPLAFDLTGNMYYASGDGGLVYCWTLSQVQDSIDGATLLDGGAVVLNLSGTAYAGFGTSSMLVNDDVIYLVLNDWSTWPDITSVLFAYDMFTDSYVELLRTVGQSFGQINIDGSGNMYVSHGGTIYQFDNLTVVPEPTTWALLFAGCAVLVILRKKQSRSAAKL